MTKSIEEHTDSELKNNIKKIESELRKEKYNVDMIKKGLTEIKTSQLQKAIIEKENNLKKLHEEKFHRIKKNDKS